MKPQNIMMRKNSKAVLINFGYCQESKKRKVDIVGIFNMMMGFLKNEQSWCQDSEDVSEL